MLFRLKRFIIKINIISFSIATATAAGSNDNNCNFEKTTTTTTSIDVCTFISFMMCIKMSLISKSLCSRSVAHVLSSSENERFQY